MGYSKIKLFTSLACKYLNKDSNKKEKFYRDIIAVDMKFTSLSKEVSFMYIWTVNINGKCFYGRTWEQFINFVDSVKSSGEKTFVIWFHNLSILFRFIECVIPFDKVFATSPHKVLYAQSDNVMFRCSKYMSNCELNELSDMFSLETKTDNNFNENFIRHKDTYITPEEWEHLYKNSQVLYEYIRYMLSNYKNFSQSNMALTFVGETRNFLRKRASEDKQYHVLRDIVMKSSPDNITLYNAMRRAFAGAFSHSLWIHRNQTIENVHMLDKESFYTSIMCKEKFPRTFRKLNNIAKQTKFYELVNSTDTAVIADIAFFNLKPTTNHSIISKHKCSYIKNGNYIYNKGEENTGYKKPVFDHGRVVRAEILVITITELDFDNIKKFYTFDYIRLGNVYYSRKTYLPKTFINTLLDLYKEKTELKGVSGKEKEYNLRKIRGNAIFGCMVTDILQQLIIYDQTDRKWGNEEEKTEELIKYKEKRTSIFLYQIGLYITAYARNEILDYNYHIGDDVIYNDTDSVILINYSYYHNFIKEYDEKVKNQLISVCNHYNIDVEKLCPCDKNGLPHFLGTLQPKGIARKFKVLGTKRYIYEDFCGNLEAVISGLPPESMVKYLKKFDDPFEAFNNQLKIKSKDTGIYTFFYTEPCPLIEIFDCFGYCTTQEVYTGISKIPQKFELNFASQFREFLKYTYDLGLSHEERLKDIKKLTKRGTLWESEKTDSTH